MRSFRPILASIVMSMLAMLVTGCRNESPEPAPQASATAVESAEQKIAQAPAAPAEQSPSTVLAAPEAPIPAVAPAPIHV